MSRIATVLACTALLVAGSAAVCAEDTSMSFFVTSQGPGDGANLGGLDGADAHCQKLASTAGAGAKTWHAYLSTSKVSARDRIGSGPWFNFKGVMIAKDVADLHSDNNKISKQTALSETGAVVNGRGDSPNMHDMLTGSKPDGTVAEGKTCKDWTSNSDGTAVLGHHDRLGLGDDAPSHSWNSSHDSRGCDPAGLKSTGGNGLFYCFAAK